MPDIAALAAVRLSLSLVSLILSAILLCSFLQLCYRDSGEQTAGPQGFAQGPDVDRGPQDHLNGRILQTMVSGIRRCLGPSNENAESSCLCGRGR